MMTEERGGLKRLSAAFARDLAILNQPAADWVAEHTGPDGQRVTDVLIVGAGMCGLTAAFELRRVGISKVRIVDGAMAGFEGPWRTHARMETLRSPKHLTGPAVGLPNLTFRAWYEARFGAPEWDELGLIPREMWADYLGWYGELTGSQAESETRLLRLEAATSAGGGKLWRATLQQPSGAEETVFARFVVLATGREGLAVPRVPAPFVPFRGDGVDHTGDAPLCSKMSGGDVAVIGLGASAFDYAAEALEAGAGHVHILGRSAELSRINKAKQIGYAGFLHGFPKLDDAAKSEIFEYIFARGISPPHGTVLRVMRHDNVTLTLGAPVESIDRGADSRLELRTPRGEFQVDHVVLGTGYRIEISASSYLENLAPSIRTWRSALPDRETAGEFLDFPYLGDGFQFLPVCGASLVPLDRLLCFNHAAMMSLGNLANDIPAVSEGADRLVRYIAGELFVEDRARHRADLQNYVEAELHGDEIPDLSAWWPKP